MNHQGLISNNDQDDDDAPPIHNLKSQCPSTFKIENQLYRVLMRMSDQDDDDAGAATAKTPGTQAQVLKAGHGEFFERDQLEILIAKLVHERHIAAIRLQRHIF